MSRDPFNRRWNPLEIIGAGHSISADQAATVIDIVGLGPPTFPEWLANTKGLGAPEALAFWMNCTAFNLRDEERRQSSRTRKDMADRAEKAARLTDELLNVITEDGALADDFGLHSLVTIAAQDHALKPLRDDDVHGVEWNRAAQGIEWVKALQSWLVVDARQKREAAETRRSAQPRRGRRKDHAVHRLIDELAHVYRMGWDREPGLSRDGETGALGGPFFRFVAHSFPLLVGERKDDEALASLIRQNLAMAKKDPRT